MGAAAVRLPAWPMAGAAPRQAQYRRDRKGLARVGGPPRNLGEVGFDERDRHGERRPPAKAWSGPGRARPVQPQSTPAGGDPSAESAGDGPPIPPGVDARQLAPEIRRELSTLGR